jgi:hypothetical protein
VTSTHGYHVGSRNIKYHKRAPVVSIFLSQSQIKLRNYKAMYIGFDNSHIKSNCVKSVRDTPKLMPFSKSALRFLYKSAVYLNSQIIAGLCNYTAYKGLVNHMMQSWKIIWKQETHLVCRFHNSCEIHMTYQVCQREK